MTADAQLSGPARSGRAAGHHGHGHHDRHAHDPTGPTDRDDAGLAEVLALDADLLGGYLDGATAWTAAHVVGAPRLVVDVGARTGAGTLALARWFERAAVMALDRSRPVLDRVERTACEAGVADRVGAVQVDLDDGWPAIEGADVVWASSSLHEVRDPDRLLHEVHDALAPGGVLVVAEMDSLPRFLPDDEGRGVEGRVHAVLDRAGWNHHPGWGPHLERAGFEVAGRRRLPSPTGRYGAAPSTRPPDPMSIAEHPATSSSTNRTTGASLSPWRSSHARTGEEDPSGGVPASDTALLRSWSAGPPVATPSR